MPTALDDFGTDKTADIINEVYDNDVIPEDQSRDIFIMLSEEDRSK